MNTTTDDVARRLNLSRTTVSKALNNRRNNFISEETRALVLRTAREMGYRPNPVARALVTGKTHLLALWINVLDSAHYNYMQRLLEAIASRHGYQIELNRRDAYSDGALDRDAISRWPVDGIIALDSPGRVQSFLQSADHPRVPLCSIGGYVADGADSCRMMVEGGAEEAMTYLFATGVRRIAIVAKYDRADFEHIGSEAVRKDLWMGPYYRMMESTGRRPEIIATKGDAMADAYLAVRDYIRDHGCPDALFGLGEEASIAAMRAVQEAGLRIPNDVQIVSTDACQFGPYLTPSLSSMAHPTDLMCERGMELLFARIQNPERPTQQIELPTRFQPRESTKPI